VDDGTDPRSVARAVAEFITSGLVIERVTVGYVRENMRACPHEAEESEPSPQLALEL